MLKLNLIHLLKLRHVNHPLPYLMRHGFTEHVARTLLSDDLKAIKLKHLTKLCELFFAFPNELFTYTGSAENHLASLKRDDIPDLSKLLANKSPKEIEAILKKLADGEL